jgi:PIN domain nuclease of toxin-antitoxin system
VRVLVDTHAALWWLGDDERLSEAAREAMASADEPMLSAASLFEVAIKSSLGKLQVPSGWADELLTEGFSLLPIGTRHAQALRELPFVEFNGATMRDPFDRLLVAQSGTEQVPVISRDPAITAHGVPTIW